MTAADFAARVISESKRPLTPADWDSDLLIPLPVEPSIRVDRIGQSYRVVARLLEAEFVFRDVRTSGELAADLAVAHRGRHLFRSTTTLSLTGRDRVAKTAQALAGEGAPEEWRRATFSAVEAVLEAEERVGTPLDLRSASLELPAGGTHIARPFWPVGSVVLVSPGDAGKSSIARALAVSIAAFAEIIPGIAPMGPPRPVLYVAGEDPVPHWHSRSIEAICRGAGMSRDEIVEPIELYDASGRSLHRLARGLAERASDFGAVILDSQQALLPPLDASGAIRDRDAMFWNAVDQLGIPTLIIAHPNRSDARSWKDADGRIAGSEVNRDRARMAWRMTWEDDAAIAGTSFRRYTLQNVKSNHGPKEGPLSFGASWTFGLDPSDPGRLAFAPSEPILVASGGSRPSKAVAEVLPLYRQGATTGAALRELMPELSPDAARQRIARVRQFLGIEEEGEA